MYTCAMASPLSFIQFCISSGFILYPSVFWKYPEYSRFLPQSLSCLGVDKFSSRLPSDEGSVARRMHMGTWESKHQGFQKSRDWRMGQDMNGFRFKCSKDLFLSAY